MKYAMKRLKASDLTLFEWQFRNANAGNQKAINLNKDVFVDKLFPAIAEAAPASGKLPVDLFIYGPAPHEALNLQRKIVKGPSYKNWRLNGEFIHNPDQQPDRFNGLKPGDVAVFGFDGTPLPDTLHLVLVSEASDQDLHTRLNARLGARSMIDLDETQFQSLLNDDAVPDEHPLRGLSVGADLADIAVGAAAPRISAVRRRGRKIDREQLAKGQLAAALVGRVGEEIVRAWFEAQKDALCIDSYEWVSDTDAIAPYDFTVTAHGTKRLVEVKATSGPASRPFPISMAEIEEAATSSDPYDIIRVSEVDVAAARGKIHMCGDIQEYAKQVLAFSLEAPVGCTVDGVSIDPSAVRIQFLLDFTVPASEEQ